jgi:hypothetical protein
MQGTLYFSLISVGDNGSATPTLLLFTHSIKLRSALRQSAEKANPDVDAHGVTRYSSSQSLLGRTQTSAEYDLIGWIHQRESKSIVSRIQQE